MRRLLNTTTITLLTLAFPLAALADLTGKPTLNSGSSLNLDTGAISGSVAGGDIVWNGASIVPLGAARQVNLGNITASGFAVLTQQQVTTNPGYSTQSIPANVAVSGDVFFVHTNTGNYAAVLVTAQSLSGISLQFITYGASAAGTAPSITQILNNYSVIPAGFPNSGVAQGALFIIKGFNLALAGSQALPLQSSTAAGGLPTTLNGSSVSVTSGGVTVTPVFYYAIASQLALVLPSNTPIGTATATVTYNGQTSTPFSFQVVKTAMGFGAYYGTGSGLGLAVNTTTGTLYNYGTAVLPGATILLYGTGLGADSARDTQYVGAGFPINNLAHIYVGGIDVTPANGLLYQGASGFPGLNQVNLTIPANAPLGCNIPITGVTAAGIPTNTITIPISINGACTDPALGLTGTQLQNLSTKVAVSTGLVSLGQATSTTASGTSVANAAFATFQTNPGSVYTIASALPSLNGCVVSQSLSGTSSASPATALDPGNVSVSGQTGALVPLTALPSAGPGYFAVQLAPGFIPPTGGQFSFAGSGGTTPGIRVGNFSATVSFSNPPMTWTNQGAATSVNRANGLLVQWGGGAITSFIVITGASSSGSASGSFTCYIPTSNSQFQVPGYVTSALPSGPGSVTVANYSNYSSFTAAGLDYGAATGFISYDVTSTFN